ncbi:MAG: TonB-dependent receptor [Caulobacter sp.]|nr:TonB-dependent receptor [Caulobacter sp.]
MDPAALLCCLMMVSPSARFDTPPQDLTAAVIAVSKATGTEILFQPSLLAGARAPILQGNFNAEQALGRLLAGTHLTFRATATGALIIIKPPAAAAPALQTPEPAVALPEIVVVGARTHDTDIRRRIDDVQPYAVLDRRALERTQGQDAEAVMRKGFTQINLAAPGAYAVGASGGDPRSRFDLRGFGALQTLVLIDGRRLPEFVDAGFSQANLNGLPLLAIDRVEALASTAGGLYGPGATGGVLNVVLKQRSDGARLQVSRGISARGDAPTWSLDSLMGWRSRNGATQVTLAYRRFEDGGLLAGDRDYYGAAQRRRLEIIPELYAAPPSNSLNITSVDHKDLRLTPGNGGAILGGAYSFLPLSLVGASSAVSTLVANAGRYDLSLSPDAQGATQNLLPRRRTDGLVFSLQHDLDPRTRLFVDLVAYEVAGSGAVPLLDTVWWTVPAGSPGNPFVQPVRVSLPLPGYDGRTKTTVRTWRGTAGAVVRLPHAWSLNADLSRGESAFDRRDPVVGDIGGLDPFLDLVATYAALPGFLSGRTYVQHEIGRLTDLNLRLAGPLATLPGGPLTITLLGEARRDTSHDAGDATLRQSPPGRRKQMTVGSLYAEVRAPILPADASFALSRGLELQLALSRDSTRLKLPTDNADMGLSQPGVTDLKVRSDTTAVTVGARVKPMDGLMLRASFASGYLPLSPLAVTPFYSRISLGADGLGVPDPKRGGQPAGANTTYLENSGGALDARPELARSFSAGVVLTPNVLAGLRVSLDFTRIVKSPELSAFRVTDDAYWFSREDDAPGHVVRAPLSAADVAAGYTGGVITRIEAGYANFTRTVVKVVDLNAEYERATPLGDIRLFTSFSWEPDFVRTPYPGLPSFNRANHQNGVNARNGRAGLDWARGDWEASLSAQYCGPTLVTRATLNGVYAANAPTVAVQGGERIAAQTYVDLLVARTWSLPGSVRPRRVRATLGVTNLLDRRAAFSAQLTGNLGYEDGAATGPGYSPYGDPRGRFFQLGLSLEL